MDLDYSCSLVSVGNHVDHCHCCYSFFNNVDEALDGSQALQTFQSKEYGLVISDWNMEPMSGIELLKEVRGGSKNADVPFIMITAESKTENVIAAKQAGVSNYIVKPFNAETLKQKISSVIGDF